MLSIKYIPACLNDWLTAIRQIDSFSCEGVWQSEADWQQASLLAVWWVCHFPDWACQPEPPTQNSLNCFITALVWGQKCSFPKPREGIIKRRERREKNSICASECQMHLPSCWQIVFAHLMWESLTASWREKMILLGFMVYLWSILNSLKAPFHQNGLNFFFAIQKLSCVCFYKRVIGSLIHPFCLKTLIHSGMKQIIIFISESLISFIIQGLLDQTLL